MNPYKILGITEKASDEEVKRAYRAMAVKYHPDKGGDAWVFEQVREAYEAIVRARRSPESNPARRPAPQSPPPPTPPAPERPVTAAYTTERQPTYNSAQNVSLQSMFERVFNVLFKHKLPLQTETNFFILANVLDIVFTNVLLRMHAIEANPIANYVFIYWGFNGMIAFKLFLVACVCLITQWIAVHHLRRARQTLCLGIAIVGTVVIYSAYLLSRG